MAAPAGADVFLTDASGQRVLDQKKVPPGQALVVFDKLRPGNYKVSATLGDKYDDDQKDVAILPRTPAIVTLNLPLLTYTVTFTTNVAAGEVRYALGEEKPGKGFVRTGTTSIAPISNKQAIIRNLKPGLYGVDIVPDKITGYDTSSLSINVDGDETFPITLKKNESKRPLSLVGDAFRRQWEVPANWSATAAGLQVRGRGISYTRDPEDKYYADFELQSDVRLRNGVGASFAVHAEDAQNYYLIQLTGARADDPYVLRGFIVANGVQRSLGEAKSIRLFSSTLNSSQSFTVTMKVRGGSFEVWLTDNETGRSEPAGVLTDPNLVFPKGAVGIAGGGNEEFDVISFILTPKS